jgi:hypothetical protein
LRGGGIKYTEISIQIATRISPRELIELAEQGDVEKLCQTSDISRDRAMKVITRLREIGGSDILGVRVEDDVEFSLLDENQFKTIDHLSTGQRCTVCGECCACDSSHRNIGPGSRTHLQHL